MYSTPDGHGGAYWHPSDDNTGLDGSERHNTRAPRASTAMMMRAVSQANYARKAAPSPAEPLAEGSASRADQHAHEVTWMNAVQRAAYDKRMRELDAQVIAEFRRADSVRLQDDGFTSGP